MKNSSGDHMLKITIAIIRFSNYWCHNYLIRECTSHFESFIPPRVYLLPGWVVNLWFASAYLSVCHHARGSGYQAYESFVLHLITFRYYHSPGKESNLSSCTRFWVPGIQVICTPSDHLSLLAQSLIELERNPCCTRLSEMKSKYHSSQKNLFNNNAFYEN